MTKQLTKRAVLKAAGALGFSAFAVRVAAAPTAEAVTPALIDAAKKEGKVSFYTAMDLEFAERLAKAFESKYPGVAVRVERSGAVDPRAPGRAPQRRCTACRTAESRRAAQ